MVVHQLTHADCLGFLSRASIGRLACTHGDQPYVVPISLYFDGTAGLYSFSAVGQKIQWMRDNPKVCVEVDDIADRFHWTSVVVTGTYEELGTSERQEAQERRAELRNALEALQARPEFWLPGTAQLTSGETRSAVVVYRVRINTISGRRAGYSATS